MLFYIFFLMIRRPPRSTLFPTRRSSDLVKQQPVDTRRLAMPLFMDVHEHVPGLTAEAVAKAHQADLATQADRKSTRLNSSHMSISYAVFCLKKKKHRRKATADNHD